MQRSWERRWFNYHLIQQHLTMISLNVICQMQHLNSNEHFYQLPSWVIPQLEPFSFISSRILLNSNDGKYFFRHRKAQKCGVASSAGCRVVTAVYSVLETVISAQHHYNIVVETRGSNEAW